MYGMDLSFGQQLTIVLTATLASIGTAAVPGVGIVMLVIVLEAVGLPLEGIAVILGVDRILDMCRTSVNVTGDCMVASVVAHSEKELATEDEIAERLAREEAEGLDEHPHEAVPISTVPGDSPVSRALNLRVRPSVSRCPLAHRRTAWPRVRARAR